MIPTTVHGWLVCVVSALLASRALAAPCTDGVDCLCDVLPQTRPDVVYCEDFEDPGFDVPGPLTAQSAWLQKYGTTVMGNCEGEGDTCPFNIVTEGNCQATNETDCVHDGLQTLGHKFIPGEDGGGIGVKQFLGLPTKTIGITYAVRYSPTYYISDSTPALPGCEEAHTGVKTNFIYNVADAGANRSLAFGGSENVFNSCNAVACTPSDPCGTIIPTSHPFGAFYLMENCLDPETCDSHRPTVEKGWHCNSAFHKNFYPDDTLYHYGVTPGHGNGQWMCMQVHWSNYGEPESHVRYWMNGERIVDAAYVDTTRARGNQGDGFNILLLTNFYNGCYNGPDLAYRYEDDIVFVTGDEPVPCSAIGFVGMDPPPPGPLTIKTFEGDPAVGLQPLDVAFRAIAGGGTPPYTYEIDCDDGVGFVPAGGPVPGIMPFFTSCPPFTAAGSPYTPQVRVTDSAATPAVETAQTTIEAIDPLALIAYSEDFEGNLADWSTETGSFTVNAGTLDPGIEPAPLGDRILHDQPTNWVTQTLSVEIAEISPSPPEAGKCLGLSFRVDAVQGERYNLVYCDFDESPGLKLEWDDGSGNASVPIDEIPVAPFVSGTFLAGELRGVGKSTRMDFWIFSSDPGPRSGWGAPYHSFSNSTGPYNDTGHRVGVNVFRTDETDVVRFDNFSVSEVIDSDGDGLFDAQDNCPITPNPDQLDFDMDGFGQICDADFNNDGLVGIPDWNLFRSSFSLSVPPGDPSLDMNSDGTIGIPDLNLLRAHAFKPAGPSGLYCAGTVPCPP